MLRYFSQPRYRDSRGVIGSQCVLHKQYTMSSKRQKVVDTECHQLIRPILEQHVIPDLASIVLDEYMPRLHWLRAIDRELDNWVEARFPCAPDCKTHSHITALYKSDGIVVDPIRLSRFSNDYSLVGDHGLSPSCSLVFCGETPNNVITIKADAHGGQVTFGFPFKRITGIAADNFTNGVLAAAIDFMLRYKIAIPHS